jgi:hypothetical protein
MQTHHKKVGAIIGSITDHSMDFFARFVRGASETTPSSSYSLKRITAAADDGQKGAILAKLMANASRTILGLARTAMARLALPAYGRGAAIEGRSSRRGALSR